LVVYRHIDSRRIRKYNILLRFSKFCLCFIKIRVLVNLRNLQMVQKSFQH